MDLNTRLFDVINGFAGRWLWLDRVGIFGAEYLIVIMVIGALYLAFKKYERGSTAWLDLLFITLGSAVVARVAVAGTIRSLYYHARPYWTLTDSHLLLAREAAGSFPSGHTIFAFALAMGVYFHNKTWGRWYLIGALVVGLSRVYVGVHWPYDVLAGALLGVATAVVCNLIYKKYKYLVRL
jgi:undecaprenyl-diphosphatase